MLKKIKLTKDYNICLDKIKVEKPTVNPDETESKWMGRCVPFLIKEGRERKQAVAVCMSMYKEKSLKKALPFEEQDEKILWKIEFDSKKYPRKRAVAWCKNNNYDHYNIVETEDSLTFIQTWHENIDRDDIEIKAHKEGIKFIYASKSATFEKSIPFLPIEKSSNGKELKLVTGIVLAPEEADAQGDIYAADEIRKTAHDFISGYIGQGNKLMHKTYMDGLRIVESYIAPVDMDIDGVIIRKGSWLMSTRVENPKIWKLIKEGKIAGYSIGGISNACKEE